MPRAASANRVTALDRARWKHGRLGRFEKLLCRLTGHRGEAFQKFLQGVVVLQVVEERFDRHTGSLKHRRAAKNFRIDRDQIADLHSPYYIMPLALYFAVRIAIVAAG